jgi:hypothetical protein
MNTQPSNPQEKLEFTIRRMRLIWLSLLVSFAAFYLVTLLNERPEDAEPNNTLFLVFIVIALTTILVSFVVKKRFFHRAVETQQVELVQQGYIVAGMLCEVGALLGIVDYFSTGDPYYYILIIIAAFGQLLHFPRREHVLNASFREKGDSSVGYGL